MLIDCGLTNILANGYLLEGYSIAIMLYDDVLTDGRIELGYTRLQGLKFFFKGLELTVFLDGTIHSSDPSFKPDATNSSVLKHGGCGAKGYTAIFAIPLKRFGLDGMTARALEGKTIRFDAVFYNAQYNETRHYEGPSKGDLAGVIRLGVPVGAKKETGK